jgi:hypothetical protein
MRRLFEAGWREDGRPIEVVTNTVTKNIFRSQKRKRPARWLT